MEARARLQQAVRDPAADPAEVALAVSSFHDRTIDIPTQLLRVDALADVVRTSDGLGGPAQAPSGGEELAARLRDVLGARLGYRGDRERPRTSDDAHLHLVLDQHHGLPVTLSALYVAVARRLKGRAYVVNLPGHVVAAVLDGERPIVMDAFDGGRVLDETATADLVHRATAGRATYRRAMVRPATPAELARRILANLTVDLTRERTPSAAIWTVVARLALPDPDPRDHLVLASLLERSGHFVRAAEAYDRYIDVAPDGGDVEEVRAKARAARARTN